jgi:riboflavin biosynthesis pyrimidine reductase
MAQRLLRLYPGPPQERTLAGAYLAHDLASLGSPAAPFVYADFVASLDGRIALRDPETGASHVPQALRSAGDFRLLLELQAQADCLITHGGYLRAIAAGELDDILQVGLGAESRDLARWRERRGLAAQPAVAVVSASLDFTLPRSLAQHGQRVLVATTAAAPAERRERLGAEGCEVILAGEGRWVEAAPLTEALGARGFRSLFLLAGPRLLEGMLRAGLLDRLYLTLAHRLLGGERFHSLIGGPELGPAGKLRLAALYGAPEGEGEWFAQFDTPREPRRLPRPRRAAESPLNGP